MAINYEHSNLFHQLKQVSETIKDNYSSSQYITVLDRLLHKAIKPIIEHTDFASHYLSELLHLCVANHRRKVSNLHRDKIISAIFVYLSTNRQKRFSIFKSLKLERNFAGIIITDLLEKSADYEKHLIASVHSQDSLKEKSYIENTLHYVKDSDKTLLSVIKESQQFFALYKDFKKQILEKYIRSIIVAAQNHYVLNDSKMELDEIIQVMFMYSAYALDKYDQSKGTLTAYIATWLQHARNQASVNELETSFSLPPSKRNTVKNSSVALDTLIETPVQDVDTTDTERIRYLAKIADPLGYARLSMDIQEYLTKQERDLQKQVALL